MKKSLILALLVLGALSLKAQAVIGPEHQEHAAALVQQMTLDEKISLIAGYQDGFHTAPVERLGIPEIRMADGPQGVRNNTKSTLFACGVAAAASWNPSLVREMGVALGQDSRARGVHILLGPGVNICRSPLCGFPGCRRAGPCRFRHDKLQSRQRRPQRRECLPDRADAAWKMEFPGIHDE